MYRIIYLSVANCLCVAKMFKKWLLQCSKLLYQSQSRIFMNWWNTNYSILRKYWQRKCLCVSWALFLTRVCETVYVHYVIEYVLWSSENIWNSLSCPWFWMYKFYSSNLSEILPFLKKISNRYNLFFNFAISFAAP